MDPEGQNVAALDELRGELGGTLRRAGSGPPPFLGYVGDRGMVLDRAAWLETTVDGHAVVAVVNGYQRVSRGVRMEAQMVSVLGDHALRHHLKLRLPHAVVATLYDATFPAPSASPSRVDLAAANWAPRAGKAPFGLPGGFSFHGCQSGVLHASTRDASLGPGALLAAARALSELARLDWQPPSAAELDAIARKEQAANRRLWISVIVGFLAMVALFVVLRLMR